MARLAWLEGSASFAPDGTEPQVLRAQLVGDVDPLPDDWLLAEASWMTGLGGQLVPRNGTVQAVQLELTALMPTGDVPLSDPGARQELAVEATVEDGYGWGVSVPASRGAFEKHAIGYETDHDAPPPGMAPVDADLVYKVGAASVRFPLLTDGLSHESDRAFGRRIHSMDLAGLGPEGRYDRARINLQLDPNHGWTHGQILRELARQAGVPEEKIGVEETLGSPRRRAVDIVNEEWGNAPQECAQAAGCFLAFDPTGILVTIPMVPGGTPEWVFDLQQLAAASDLTVQATAEVPTCLIFNGDEPMLSSEGSGLRTVIEEIAVWGWYEVPGAWWIQDVDGTLFWAGVGMAGPQPVAWLLKSRVTTLRVLRGNCLMREEIIEEGFHNPQAARYSLQSDGSLSPRAGVYIHDSSASTAGGGSEPAYLWRYHRFVEKNRTTRVNFWGLGGFIDQKQEWRNEWFNPAEHLRSRATAIIAWEDADWNTGCYVLGNGAGVMLPHEYYFAGKTFPYGSGEFGHGNVDYLNGVDPGALKVGAARKAEIRNFSGWNGYVTHEEIQRNDWLRRPGWKYQFSGEDASDLQQLYGGFSEEQFVYHSAYLGSRGLISTTVTSNIVDPTKSEVRFDRKDGSLPAWEKCDNANEERRSGRPFEVEFCLGVDHHPENYQEVSNDFIENEAEALNLLKRLLIRAQAIRVKLFLPPNGALHRGALAAINIPEAGLVREGWIERIAYSRQGRNQPLLQEVALHLFPQGSPDV